MQSAPRDKLSASELIYGRPIPQAQEKGYLNPLKMEQLKYALQEGETMKALTEQVIRRCPHPLTWPYTPSGLEIMCT